MLAPNLIKLAVKINYQTHSLPLSTNPKVLIQSKRTTFGKMEALFWGGKMDGQEQKAYRIGKNPFLSRTIGLNFITPGSLDQMNLCCGMGRAAALCIVKTAVNLQEHPSPGHNNKGPMEAFQMPSRGQNGHQLRRPNPGDPLQSIQKKQTQQHYNYSLNLLRLKVNEQHISLP